MFKLRIATIVTTLVLMFVLIPSSNVLAQEDYNANHDFITCPVIVEGVYYEAEEMTSFNGQILHFVYSKDGELYAFESMSGVKKFMFDEYEYVWPEDSDSKSIDRVCNYYYVDIFQGGVYLPLDAGGIYNLTDYECNDVEDDWNDCISSAYTVVVATAYEHINRGGDSITMAPGDWNVILGWNDIISCIEVNAS